MGVDNAGGIATMIAALVELGHRRIAFLAGPGALFVARDRLAGYRRGLAEAGIAVRRALVVRTSFDRAGGALGVDTLLAGDAPFTAIACANDLLALGALERLAELGIEVPGEVSLAGFDDIAIAAMTAPASRPSGCRSASWAASGTSTRRGPEGGEPSARSCRPSSSCADRPAGRRPSPSPGARRTGTRAAS